MHSGCRLIVHCLAVAGVFLNSVSVSAGEAELKAALDRAGQNRAELEKALKEAPEAERRGMEFLIENMPDRDLTALSAEFLLENSRLTWKALNETPWAKSVPEDVVFDALLPYANVNERRDQWRQEFYDRFRQLVVDAKSPSEAASMLNQNVFPTLKVKYSTGRKKADQSPKESMESGLASCTGLSIILVDACRAVGIPARIVGTPLWSNKSGNHTWVEIWDNGWHFTGACEPTGNALNQGWFIDQASKAQRDDRLHAIYAVTFRKNGQSFPMVWAREIHDVYAVNVTDRYVALKSPVPEGHVAVRIRVRNAAGQRVSVPVQVASDKGESLYEGQSNDERFDSNDHASAYVPKGSTVIVRIKDSKEEKTIVASESEQLVELTQP
ncbi:MAG: transglutaminase-like domain-containing protein [Planctomycetaceae bacterium]